MELWYLKSWSSGHCLALQDFQALLPCGSVAILNGVGGFSLTSPAEFLQASRLNGYDLFRLCQRHTNLLAKSMREILHPSCIQGEGAWLRFFINLWKECSLSDEICLQWFAMLYTGSTCWLFAFYRRQQVANKWQSRGWHTKADFAKSPTTTELLGPNLLPFTNFWTPCFWTPLVSLLHQFRVPNYTATSAPSAQHLWSLRCPGQVLEAISPNPGPVEIEGRFYMALEQAEPTNEPCGWWCLFFRVWTDQMTPWKRLRKHCCSPLIRIEHKLQT